MGNQLQELLGEFGCSVLNYSNNKISVDHFYNEERYNDFLNGSNCRQGMGLFDSNEIVECDKINDSILIVVQQDGVETARYKYSTIFKATIEYKDKSLDNKKVTKTLTFKIRINQFTEKLNYVDTEGNSLDLYNVQDVKDYLIEKYGVNKLTDWSFRVG